MVDAHQFSVQLNDSLVNERYNRDWYDTKMIIEKAREDQDRLQEKEKREMEDNLYIQTHYSGDILQRDTTYPLVNRGPRRDPRREISKNPESFDEDEWGKDAEHFWRNREAKNRFPMQWLVNPPFRD